MTDLLERFKAALADRYEFIREAGHGGMATVYLALDRKHQRQVAVKVLRPELSDVLRQERFLREIEVVSRLTHPNIVPLYDSGEAEGFLYYVMPYVEGESLRARLTRETQLPLEDALQIAREVADALAFAHAQDVIHRDIKPENILLEAGHAVVADFGIARAITTAGGERLTDTGLAIGTVAYMSPEQAAGARTLDGRSDQYSLGCVLFEMLAGDPPFTGSSAQALIARKLNDPLPRLSVVRETVPPQVESALSRAMARVPADRFRTLGEFAAALRNVETALPSPRVAPTASHRGARRALRTGAVAVAMAGLALLGWLIVRKVIESRTTRSYSDAPTWSAWRGWTGEYFPVVAVADSMLVVARLGGHTAQVFDGEQWTDFPIPDSFDLRPVAGVVTDGRLFATRTVNEPDGKPNLQYWWMALSKTGLRPLRAISSPVPDDGRRPSWWSDGNDVAIWLDAIERRSGDAWMREPTGTSGGIASLWGRDLRHRFALPAAGDSLLVFDGIGWKLVDILDGGAWPGRPTYRAGATFEDGATVVVGDECLAPLRCRPLIVQQDSFDGAWRRARIPSGIGLPTVFPADTTGRCDPGRFTLSAVAGRSTKDYLVWGGWITCDLGSPRRESGGCPPQQPCFWQARESRLEPVAELLGRGVQAVVYLDTTAYALLDDATLWRRTGNQWRAVTQVPGLPLRLVGASPQAVVRMVGGDFRYEPGVGDTLSRFFTAPIPGLDASVGEGNPPRQLVVRDRSVALLTAGGSVFVSECRMVRGGGGAWGGALNATGAPGEALRCPEWNRIPPAPGNITAVDFLADRRLIGVGARGLAVTWRDGVVTPEPLPPPARTDSLWAVITAADGGATAIGIQTVVHRDTAGRWTLVRSLPSGDAPHARFAVLPDGDLVVSGLSLQVWDRTQDTLPTAILYRPGFAEAKVGAIHALADGRLVAGLATPDEPILGGRLIVWAAPARANQSRPVDLPINLDITDLADDGRYLQVVGRGGTLRIPLDSLPFAPTAGPK